MVENTFSPAFSQKAEYELIFYKFDIHRRLFETEKWIFIISPELKVLRIDYFDEINKVMRYSKDLKTVKQQEKFIKTIKDWLFRREADPFDEVNGENTLWNMVPSDFSDEDKEKIKFMWFQEEM